MNSTQNAHIERNLVELIKNTVCNVELLSILRQEGILSQCDIEDVRSQKTHFEKSGRLYEILPTKTGAFEKLVKALKDTKQTGAHELLEQIEYTFKNVAHISVDFNQVVGKGRSTVYRGKVDGRDVAVKVIREDLQRAIREVGFLKKLDVHENIVRFFIAKQKENKVYIALELCLVNLEDELRIRLVKSEPIRVLEECTKGVNFLHKNEIIHRDLKPANILFNRLGQVKISSFEFSMHLKPGLSVVNVFEVHGTLDWMAPEILALMQNRPDVNSSYKWKMSKKADIFLLGCIFYYVISNGQHLFGDSLSRSSNIVHNAPQWKNVSIDDVSRELITKMVSNLPSSRPTAEEILSSDFKRNIKPLSNLRPFTELNILILGEVGVGKSTWINNFINVLTYGSLEKAMGEKLLSLIPSKFYMCNQNYEHVEISVGPDDRNEQTINRYKLATQSSKVYQFCIGSTIVRLIDTPGIGNEYEQDRRSIQNIIGTLSNLEELHGICILLKPNRATLNIFFEFCIKELLASFHKDASQNILFCFTNSRRTFYRPGETLPALHFILSKNGSVKIPLTRDTVYCYDSEAYRFLAAIKKGLNEIFTDADEKYYFKSWNESVQETARMLEHIRKLKPHKIRSSLTLRIARESLLQLTQPVPEIISNINLKKFYLENDIEDLQRIDEEIKKLEKRNIFKVEVHCERLGHPRTECTNQKCFEIKIINSVHISHRRVCHDRCYLNKNCLDKIGSPELLECPCMNNGVCRCCGHSYAEHINTYFRAVDNVIQMEEPAVCESLKHHLEQSERKKRLVESKRLEIAELKGNLLAIEKSSAKLALFLKSNCIIPYNDGLGGYLEYLIQNQQAKVNAGRSRKHLEDLEASIRQYIEEKNLLDKSLESCESGVTPLEPEEVERLIEELEDSSHAGPQIRKAQACLKQATGITQSNIMVYTPNIEFSETTAAFWGKLASLFL